MRNKSTLISVVAISFFTLVSIAAGFDLSGLTESNLAAVNLYDSRNQEYTFSHPRSWTVYDKSDSRLSYLRVSNLKTSNAATIGSQEGEKYFKIEIVVFPNEKNLMLGDWIKNLMTTSYPLPEVAERKDIQVGGLPAVYQMEKVREFTHPVIYVMRQGKIYLINVSSGDGEFEKYTRDFVKSFKFK